MLFGLGRAGTVAAVLLAQSLISITLVFLLAAPIGQGRRAHLARHRGHSHERPLAAGAGRSRIPGQSEGQPNRAGGAWPGESAP